MLGLCYGAIRTLWDAGSAEGETEAAWVMAVTWSVADELLRSAASACERQVLLQRIISLDLPVPGGSGSARYGSVLPQANTLVLPYTIFLQHSDLYMYTHRRHAICLQRKWLIFSIQL